MRGYKTSNGTEIIRVIGGRSNVFLVQGKNSNILIDSGPAFMAEKLKTNLGLLGITEIGLLILTHSHFDHTGNANLIRETFGASTMIHSSERQHLEAGIGPPPMGTNWFSSLLINTFKAALSKYTRFTPCMADIIPRNFHDLKEYGLDCYIVHTPGHTSGSLSVVIDNEVAITGDTMFGIFRNSVFPPFANDVPELLRSWKKLLYTGCSLFLPSHGKEKTREDLEACLAKKVIL
ncbi:MAG: MBL fold metallo-hydrolase [Bacteroidales bacterium]